MSQRLEGKTTFVMGADCVGEGWGDGKATAVLFARQGATAICVDRDLASAERTVAIIEGEAGKASALRADITSAADIDAAVGTAVTRHGRGAQCYSSQPCSTTVLVGLFSWRTAIARSSATASEAMSINS